MKKITTKITREGTAQSAPLTASLPHLGGLTAKKFLRDYWQKKPLLIRNAFAQFHEPLTKSEVLELAQRDEAESRIVSQSGKDWDLRHGPFSSRDFSALKKKLWTVLVQDTQHFSREAHEVLAKFNFIPHARVDDLMVSYAVPGAGVGAHFDSYDVFLLQGMGSRRWQVSAQKDLRLKEGMPLKILANFKPEQEYVLETGDMLYLPPGYAHQGVAETECLTWSIGFRAPSQQEMSAALLDFLRDEIQFEGQYSDADLITTKHPGEIDRDMIGRMEKMLVDVRKMAADEDQLQKFLGTYLTEPKSHVYFDAPEPELSLPTFRQAIKRGGIELDLKTRLFYIGERFFINGEALDVAAADNAALRGLADARKLNRDAMASADATSLAKTLYNAYRDGFVHPA